MARVVFFVMFALATACTARWSTSSTPATMDPTVLDPPLFYSWLISEDDEKTPAIKSWDPIENEEIGKSMRLEADFSGFPSDRLEIYSPGKTKDYTLVVYTKKGIEKSQVTFIRSKSINSAPRLIRIDCTKNTEESWLEFYGKGFSELRRRISAAEDEEEPAESEEEPAESEEEPAAKPKPITIFTMRDCPGCEQAKDWLTKQEIAFVEKNLDSDNEAKTYLEKKLQMQTYPVPLFEINGRLLTAAGWFSMEVIQSVMVLPPPDDKSPVDKAYFLLLLNAYRKSKDLQDVAYNDNLDEAAEDWADYHAENKLKTPVHKHKGSTPAKRAKEADYKYEAVVENLARLASLHMSVLLHSWQLSSVYKKNLLHKNVTEIGLDCVEAPVGDNYGEYVCVLVLASPKERKARLVDAEE